MMHEYLANSEPPAPPAPKRDPNLGIDLRKRNVGEAILIETDSGIYELVLVQPQQCLVQVTGTDPRLHTPTIGRLAYSVDALNPADRRDGWIGPAHRLLIVFRNANFESGVVLSASIRGQDWHYDVF
jgi:hypothetical protein